MSRQNSTRGRGAGPVRCLAGGVCLAAIGCGPTEPSPLFGAPPQNAIVRLVEQPARIAGAASSPPASARRVTRSWSGDEIADWQGQKTRTGVRFTSPALGAQGLPDAGRLKARLRPGGARRVAVVPHARGNQLEREHRQLRRLVLELEPDASPSAAIEIEADLYEALHGSFGDASRGGALERLELELVGADALAAELIEISIGARQRIEAEEPAGVFVADHGGVLRPAWYAHGGVSASFAVEIPADTPELRWHDAALPGAGDRVLAVVADGDEVEFARAPAAPTEAGAPWSLRSASLARWAGRTVELQLRVEGGGTGLFGDPRILSAAPVAPRDGTRSVSGPPDVLLYMIDTLCADRLGVGGSSARDVSLTLDRLADTGVWFQLALSSSPWTKPAIATLMSGILPTTHGVGAASYTDRMPQSVPLVQEHFRAAGWRTGSFSASPLGSTLSALERGFAAAYPPRYWRGEALLDMNPSAGQLGDALLDWIDEEPDRPFFAYVHTLEVHEWKLERYRQALPEGFTAYDAAVRDADERLGELLAALSQAGRNLLVVVVSDHGESWGDHGLPSHGFGLFQSQIHVPLIFWSSRGLSPREVPEPVSLADLAPTLLHGFGLTPLEETDGRSLTGYLRGDPPPPRPVLSSLLRFVWAPDAPQQHAITTHDRVKLIRPEGAAERAFDLVIDPQESQPLQRPDAATARELDRLLADQTQRARAFHDRHGNVTPGSVTHDDVERLRALGYLPAAEDGHTGLDEPAPR